MGRDDDCAFCDEGCGDNARAISIAAAAAMRNSASEGARPDDDDVGRIFVTPGPGRIVPLNAYCDGDGERNRSVEDADLRGDWYGPPRSVCTKKSFAVDVVGADAILPNDGEIARRRDRVGDKYRGADEDEEVEEDDNEEG